MSHPTSTPDADGNLMMVAVLLLPSASHPATTQRADGNQRNFEDEGGAFGRIRSPRRMRVETCRPRSVAARGGSCIRSLRRMRIETRSGDRLDLFHQPSHSAAMPHEDGNQRYYDLKADGTISHLASVLDEDGNLLVAPVLQCIQSSHPVAMPDEHGNNGQILSLFARGFVASDMEAEGGLKPPVAALRGEPGQRRIRPPCRMRIETTESCS